MNLDRVLDNQTIFVVDGFTTEDKKGRDVLVVVAKITYAVSPAGVVELADPQPPVRPVPVPATNAPLSSVRFPGEHVDEKPGTDVMLVGTAHPPPDREVAEVDVALRVGSRARPIEKVVRVTGPRVWFATIGGVAPGPAAPLRPTPLIYELAFGGRDASDPDRPVIDERNPVGKGVARDRKSLVGQPAPQIEDPAAPLSSSKPAPAGFGPVSADWEPRASLAGTHDEAWRRRRAPIRPVDFDPRHNCSAPADLWSETPLVGDEPIEVLGATARGAWRFRLPRHAPTFSVVEGGRAADAPTHLDTLLIDADTGTVELAWRVAVPMPRKPELLDAVRVRSTADDATQQMALRTLLAKIARS